MKWLYRFLFTIVFFGKKKNLTKPFTFWKWKHISKKKHILKMNTHSETYFETKLINIWWVKWLDLTEHGRTHKTFHILKMKAHFEKEPHFQSENSSWKPFLKWIYKWAFIFKMWFFFKMCFHFQNVKGFVSFVFVFPKNTIVNKNLHSH